jgi:hypothetical protein
MTQAPNKFAALDKKVSDAQQADAAAVAPAQSEQSQTQGPAVQAGTADKPQAQPGSGPTVVPTAAP